MHAHLPVLATSSTSAHHASTSLRAKTFSAASHSSMSVSGTPVGRYRVVVSTCMLIRRCRLGTPVWEIPRRSEHMHAGQAAPSVSGAPRTGNQGRSHLARAIQGDRSSNGQSREIAPRTGDPGRSQLARAIKGDRTSPGHDADGLWMNAAVYEDHRA